MAVCFLSKGFLINGIFVRLQELLEGSQKRVKDEILRLRTKFKVKDETLRL